ncbi:urea ABC transporter ATP-binding protein UrtD [Hydrocarboniclastica marina]|uniref:Urea ABC transporter ATP-binding protein UrtD n=1 Tax=Hydrocarboniclastica marina TaxID=2259620 RepID=A0A4P7XHY7_9ALTE|nr:urea ABC transporter ATP-binding protein UrtD [Hydrocarboniclastica marina]MAL97585.1 urea ABC transporter ATP-binding protein UrtD [Alteromonadaceae bacterium]QCF26678.1 urea ABC transporter ATP-binding protein UrtD [Hydrocarboniclastica marina]|tara:strand:- start:1975 stop:2730 length:756 start_codon:yes stop_codon:yes gene_type:complete
MPRHIEQKALLYVDGVNVSFDGFKALNNLSLIMKPGEMQAIIGPNGAGKTTMMDVITGKIRPDSGTVLFRDDIDLTRYDEAAIAKLGIGRKFQKPSVIESLTIFENLELALSGQRGVFQSLFFKLTADQAGRIDEIMALVKLEDRRDTLAGSLSHGQKQWLEIGMLLIQDPDVLLIDEPAAGMTDAETARTAELFRDLAKKYSLVVVEHDMEFIEALDCRVTVLHEGSVLAEGSLAQVKANQKVVEVYLGR